MENEDTNEREFTGIEITAVDRIVGGNSTEGLYGPRSSSYAERSAWATRAGLTDEQIAVMIAQRILAKSGNLRPTPEQKARIWTRLTQRLGWRR